ncbi:TPA: DUF4056 domain-containing protein [Vibrio vulnificus]|nr:DUF4056 domain-containing protein [Vibrio vulnificus]HAS8597411.1 DUF4056 domain-containing protein [Vibrio vulnificus]
MMKMNKTTLLLLLASFSSSVFAEVDAPVGVRPCCAFGYDLKAQLGGIPVPFFSVGNVVDADKIGQHRYNDGSQSVSGNLLGLGDESNGLIFTQHAGFIDTAHVRDTADYTFYLYQENLTHLGQEYQVELKQELRVRQIHWQPQFQAESLSQAEKVQRSADAAAFIAFQLAQWHEIAQWFGLMSVGGFDEFASAFSPEDLYSNMLGAQLAKQVILAAPTLDKKTFSKNVDHVLQQRLSELKAQSKKITQQKIEALDGLWWDSARRLPDKWLLLKRDYQLAYTLQPNYPGSEHTLSLNAHFSDGSPISDWVSLKLIASNEEKHFSALPDTLKKAQVWTHQNFANLADFAYEQDARHHPKSFSPQVGEE